jgi:uncharacterized protein (TIGR02145 family)
MKKTIYLIAGVLLLFSCKKESSNPTSNTTNSNSTTIAKYGNGVTDIDGNKYKTTIIGTQEWMAENLKTTKYSDGTAVPNVTNQTGWLYTETGAWCNKNNSDSLGIIYGKLYNWYAVSPTTNGNKNVCPTGWHVPTQSEWNKLGDYLGGWKVAGGKMKSADTTIWNIPNVGATNTSLFNGLPGGSTFGGPLYEIGVKGNWWSSSSASDNGQNIISFYLRVNEASLQTSTNTKNIGYSIRCVKD